MNLQFYPFKQHLSRLLLGILLIYSSVSQAQVCSNPNMLFGLDGSGNIYKVDPTTAVVGSAINTASYTSALSYTTIVAGQTSSPSSPNALGYNNINGNFYYFKRDPGGSGSQFVSYSPLFNKYTTLATAPISASVHAGCVSFSGNGYYCLDVNSNLYYYDILLNTWKLVCSVFTDQFGTDVTAIFKSMSTGDMAIDGLGNLWIMPSNGTKMALYKIVAPLPTSPVAGITAQQIIAPTKPTPSGTSIYGMAFDPGGNIFMSTSDNKLFKLSSPTGTPVLKGSLTVSGLTDLSSCSFPLTILPVSWTAFTATLQNKGTALLNWSVSEAPEGSGFTIERSFDGLNWQPAGFIENNPAYTNYSFTDLNPGDSKNYYRIKLVSYNGAVTYSATRLVTGKNTEKVYCWPNPVTDILYIQTGVNTNNTSNSYALGFDLSGKVLFKKLLQPGTNAINLNTLPSSTYQVVIHLQSGEVLTQTIIKR